MNSSARSPFSSDEATSEPDATAAADDAASLPRLEPDRSQESAEAARSSEAALLRELSARDQTIAGLRSSFKEAVRDRELATALAGRPLVANAVGQLIKLLRDDLDVYEDQGAYKVASRDGREVAEWVAERLASAAYSHFCLPTSRGGVVAKGPARPGPRESPPPTARTLGEIVVSQWRASGGSAAGAGGWLGRR